MNLSVLNELVSRDGRVRWQARIGADRGRLEVVGIVAPSATPTEIEPLGDVDLRALLAGSPAEQLEPWLCNECRTLNEPMRQWCRGCSQHARGGL
jgi:hypothetical protein